MVHCIGVLHLLSNLFSLAKVTQNWQIEDRTDADNIRRFYINVCRPIVPVLTCSPFGSVCVTNIDKSGKVSVVVFTFKGNDFCCSQKRAWISPKSNY